MLDGETNDYMLELRGSKSNWFDSSKILIQGCCASSGNQFDLSAGLQEVELATLVQKIVTYTWKN